MVKSAHLVKSLAALCVPLLLFALAVIQIYRCKSILILRNCYLLESLPDSSQWMWNALAENYYLESVTSTTAAQSSADTSQEYSRAAIVSQSLDPNYHSRVLLPGMPSLTVHYLWCIDGHFELGHYITILSIIHQLQPDRIVIHYRTEPRSDPRGYWRWLEDLKYTVVMLSMRPLSTPQLCRHDLSAGVDHDDFPDPYGVFILGDVTVTNLTRSHVLDLMIKSFLPERHDSHLKSNLPLMENDLHVSQVFLVSDTEPYHISQSQGRTVIACPSMKMSDKLLSVTNVPCMSMNSYVLPEDIFKRNTSFYRFSRNLMYGSPEPIQPDMASTVQIPNIIHIILMEGIREITPLVYVSIKSAYFRGKADEVYIHGPNPPSGFLWDQLHKLDKLNVRFIPCMSFSENGNNNNAAVIYALYTLLQNGGIAHFGDIVFTNPILSLARHASAVATLHYSEFRLKHRSINTAILVGAKGSKYLESVLAMLRQGGPWSDCRADDIATHVTEIYPTSVLLDPQLTSHQTCSNGRCQVVGGHRHPRQTYSTRLIWQGKQPQTLEDLKHVEGPSHNDINDIIDSHNDTNDIIDYVHNTQAKNVM